jgi:ABC-2 type transport system permease protein
MKYIDITISGVKEALVYRADFFIGLLNGLINLLVLWFIWNAVFAASEVSTIGGFTLSAMMTYVVISASLKPLTYPGIEHRIEWDVRDGRISTLLTKPMSYPLFRIFKGFSHAIFVSITNVLPIVFISILLIGISAPVNVLAFLISVILGYFVNYMLAFLTGMWAFWSEGSVWGLKLSREVIMDIMSGALIPLYFFPTWFFNIAVLLPFQTIFHIPLSIYLGKITGINIFYSISQQIIWLMILGSLTYFIWKKAEKKVIVHGG